MNDRNSYFAAVFSRELDRWKKEKNLSQEDFAIAIGLSGKNMITRYKKGTAYPEPETLESICSELGVDQSIFHPQTFEDWFSYSEKFRQGVFADQEAREHNAIHEAGIDLLFWEYLWRKIPYTKMVMPLYESDISEDLICLKKTNDDWHKVYRQDIEFVRQLQDDVSEYITMILMKKALQQRLGESSDVRVVQVLFDLAKDLIVHDNSKEDTNGID